MGHILIVEDEADIADLVKYHLDRAGLPARTVADGRQAMELIAREHPDLIVLDLLLPGVQGLEICRRVRAGNATHRIPIVILTARSQEADRIVGLELGADDYIVKPFSPREVVARVKAIVRRATDVNASSDTPVSAGPVRLDPVRHLVTKHGTPLDLSVMEFRLLEFFLRHPEHVFTRTQLLDRVWGAECCIEPRSVDVHIRRLRELIEDDPAEPGLILTVRGVGYKCHDDGHDA